MQIQRFSMIDSKKIKDKSNQLFLAKIRILLLSNFNKNAKEIKKLCNNEKENAF